jgi:hypothetical protein
MEGNEETGEERVLEGNRGEYQRGIGGLEGNESKGTEEGFQSRMREQKREKRLCFRKNGGE